MQKRILAAMAVLLLAGCQTPQTVPPPVAPGPSATPPVPPRAQQPAMPPIRSAGPLSKATVGTYMDSQESDLRSYLRGQGVQISRRGDGLAVTLQSDRLFDHGEISDWGDAFLRAMVQVLGHYDHTLIAVNGYSDAGSNPDAAVAASQKRAKLVADGLIHYGIASGRISVNGLGATNLRIANAADAKNRRVEIKITPDPK
jgi:outer membrane protein OmpA-like peptidoglycan-associated protein